MFTMITVFPPVRETLSPLTGTFPESHSVETIQRLVLVLPVQVTLAAEARVVAASNAKSARGRLRREIRAVGAFFIKNEFCSGGRTE